MDPLWALVEWVDENNVFPSYALMKLDRFAYQEHELQPGKQIFLCLNNGDPRRAKIIKISDNKRHLKEHKELMERQDQQVKNVMQLCMRTIKDMRSSQFQSAATNSHSTNTNGSHSALPQVITATESTTSDSDSDEPQIVQMNKISKFKNQTHQTVRYDHGGFKKGTQSPAVNLRRRSVVSSTPVPEKSALENIKLCFDQGTQTDDWIQPSVTQIEELETGLKHLYQSFQNMILRSNATEAYDNFSETEQNGEVSYAETNASWGPNNGAEHAEANLSVDMDEQNVPIVNQRQDAHLNNSVKMETADRNENTRVRRMSAQTTYSNEMVPIGDGRAMVPARLLNDINWNSYTTATRQLLQAIFPRKVLATHSLTGKASPAHQDKPPKKLLSPALVDDIVATVASKCGVAKNLVRNVITVKCTDEAKLYRNRQLYRLSRSQQKTQQNENDPSTVNSSEVTHFQHM